MHTPHPQASQRAIDPAVIEQAALWMARLWSDDASPADRSACDQWRAAHPDHELGWQRLQAMEGKLRGLPASAARTLLDSAPTTSRRQTLQLLGLSALAAGTGYGVLQSDAWRSAGSDHRTRTGETRDIELVDGSRVVLNTATAIDVRFDTSERRVILRAGEILVTTSARSTAIDRPFQVQSLHGTVEALGTRFSVRQERDASHVAVFHGAVQIQPLHTVRQPLRIGVDQRTSFSEHGVQPPVSASETEAAWSQGLLIAENMRVENFLQELGRYRHGLLRCAPEVADLRVSGVFSLRDTDRALANLQLALPVQVVYRTAYWVTVQAA